MKTPEELKKKIVLYGAGVQNVRFAYQAVASAGLYVEKIVDKDPQKQGTHYFGTEVTSLEWLFERDRNGEDYNVVITVRTPKIVEEIKKSLSALKNSSVYSTEEFLQSMELNRKVKRIFGILFHLTDHCNLNCAYCSHYSPLVSYESCLDLKVFERDLERLHRLTGGDISDIQLVGGEPLLHPQAKDFPVIIRKYFPKAEIVFITNGLELPKMSEEFFDICKECRAQIHVTRYPIRFHYDEIVEQVKRKGVNIQFCNTGNSEGQHREMEIVPIRLKATKDASANSDACMCQSYPVRNGRIFSCVTGSYIDFFNDYFHTQLPSSEQNGIDLFSVKDLQELTDKLSRPSPICAYCDSTAPFRKAPWSISKRDISEWTLSDD